MREAITEFLNSKSAAGLTARTIHEYDLYLTAFAAHCGKELAAVTNADVVAWIAEEKKKSLADASILARVKALKVFFTWCVYSDLLTKTPVKMPRPKVRQKRARLAVMADVTALLNQPCVSWLDYRNRALVHLLHDTGMRIGEARSLLVEHVDLGNRIVCVPAAKDNEVRLTPFTSNCAQAIRDYLAIRPKGKYEQWLFFGGKGKGIVAPLTYSGARQILERTCQAAGVPYINAHSIRHLFATRALNNGMRVEVVSKILGHSSVDLTLSVYAKLMTETIQREYQQHWGD